MKHHKSKRKFGRKMNQRNALLQSLARSLVRYEKIVTTEAKAKELRPFIEKIITNSRTGSLTARRKANDMFGPKVGKKLIDTIAPIYKDRKGGYTRIIKLPLREKDATKMAHIELIK